MENTETRFLNKDELFLLAIQLDLPDLLNFCNTNTKTRLFCENTFWKYKLKTDFPDVNIEKFKKSDEILTDGIIYQLLVNLQNLSKMDLISNVYNKLKENLYDLYQIKKLDLNGTEINSIFRNFKHRLNNLIEYAINQGLNEEEIQRVKLEYLDKATGINLEQKRIVKIPKEIGWLYNLELLNLNNNLIKELPSSFKNLRNLKTLFLVNNKFEIFPNVILKLYNLEELSLSYNKITNIPKDISNLKNLKQLYLNNNKLKDIPKEIGLLDKLTFLSLNGNDIQEIPIEVENSPNLKILL